MMKGRAFSASMAWGSVAASIIQRIVKPSLFARAGRKIVVFAVVLTAACAAPHLVQILQPVGPAPIASSSLNTGRLIVYTEGLCADCGDEMSSDHEPYTVLDSSSRLLRTIDNRGGDEVVPLPSGRYLIRAQATGWRIIAAEVHIVAGRTTEVHLDGKWKPAPSNPPPKLVFAPDGSPVGYETDSATAPPESEGRS